MKLLLVVFSKYVHSLSIALFRKGISLSIFDRLYLSFLIIEDLIFAILKRFINNMERPKNTRKSFSFFINNQGIITIPKGVTLENFIWMVTSYDSLKFRDTENFLFELVRKSNSNYVLVDIGANIGSFSLHLNNELGERFVYFYLFEPIGENFLYLKENAKNNLRNFSLFNLGLLDRDGYAFFDTEGGLSTFHVSSNGRGVKIRVRTIDSILSESPSSLKYLKKFPVLLKIDVEREELKILKGASNLLEKSLPLSIIVVEINEDKDKVINYLDKKGFKLLKNFGNEFVFLKSL